MRVTVFGATGRIGRLVVERLLTAGDQVTAYARNPAKLTLTNPHLTVVSGQLTDPDTIHTAISGSQAVISTLGPPLNRSATGTPLTDGTRTIIQAMRQEGVRRYIGLATPSIPDPQDKPHWKHTVLPIIANLAFPNALTELRAMTAAVNAADDLDWTIARITNPTDKPASGTIRAGFLGHDKIRSSISRADVAAFLVAQLTDNTYTRAAPAISN